MEDIFKKHNIRLPNIIETDNMDNPLILAHFTHPSGAEWHIIAGDYIHNDNGGIMNIVLFGIGKITHEELGTFTLAELYSVGAEWDDGWEPLGLYDLHPEWR